MPFGNGSMQFAIPVIAAVYDACHVTSAASTQTASSTAALRGNSATPSNIACISRFAEQLREQLGGTVDNLRLREIPEPS